MDFYNIFCKIFAFPSGIPIISRRVRGRREVPSQILSKVINNSNKNNTIKLVEFHTLEDLKYKMAFRDKNAVITGGARGIGLQVCKQLLANEASVRLIAGVI